MYNGTPSGSPARRLIVELFAQLSKADTDTLGRDTEMLPRDFLVDLGCFLFEKRDVGRKDWVQPWQRPDDYMEKLRDSTSK